MKFSCEVGFVHEKCTVLLRVGVGTFFCEEPDSNLFFGFVGQMVFDPMKFCFCNMRAVIDNMQTNEHGCVSIKLYLWILKFESHIIFVYHKIFI